MIEDTSFVIDVMKGDEGALDRLENIEARNVPEKLSAITVLELYEGLYRVEDLESEGQLISDVILSKSVVTADADLMRAAGELSGRLISNGVQIDREDCVIAVTALRESEPVLTRNVDHFRRIEGLDVETY